MYKKPLDEGNWCLVMQAVVVVLLVVDAEEVLPLVTLAVGGVIVVGSKE